MTNLEWAGDRIARKAQGWESEFAIFNSCGQFTVQQRQQIGPKSRRKVRILRQATGLTLNDAFATAQEWEDSPLPTAENNWNRS